jgi:hypothetical protein
VNTTQPTKSTTQFKPPAIKQSTAILDLRDALKDGQTKPSSPCPVLVLLVITQTAV